MALPRKAARPLSWTSVQSKRRGLPSTLYSCIKPGPAMLDIFAWIVLVVLAGSTIAVIVIMAMLPGMIAKHRKHPWAQAVTVGGWVTLFFGFVLWPIVLIWAYVDVPPAKGVETMR